MIKSAGSARRSRWASVIGLMLLSPFCAEYLIGYQGVITSPFGMLVAVLMVLPIYGAPAVIIREITRRTGRGWPTMLLLATAAGLIQAGLIDQSLFNHADFGDASPLLIPVLDVDAGQVLTFVGGHVIWSFGAPIAVVESLAPRRARTPWLGRTSLLVIGLLYLAGGIFYYNVLVRQIGFAAHPLRLIGVAVLAIGLVLLATVRWPEGPQRVGWTPGPVLVGGSTVVLAGAFVWLDEVWGWWGLVLRCLLLVLLGVMLAAGSRRPGWGQGHVLAVAAAALMVYAALAFVVNPEHTAQSVLFTARGVVAAGVVILLAVAAARVRRAGRTRPAPSAQGAPP